MYFHFIEHMFQGFFYFYRHFYGYAVIYTKKLCQFCVRYFSTKTCTLLTKQPQHSLTMMCAENIFKLSLCHSSQNNKHIK